MKVRTLIKIDSAFGWLYWLVAGYAKIWPTYTRKNSPQLIVKFFGIGSLVRIAHVINQSGENKAHFTFLTLKKNAAVLNQLGFKVIQVGKWPKILLPFELMVILVQVINQSFKVVDFERNSNLSGIFTQILAIGKPRVGLSFTNENLKGNKVTLNAKNQAATELIAQALNLKHNPNNYPSFDKKVKNVWVNINAGDYLAERKYPAASWIKIIEDLAKEFPGWHFNFGGAPSEYNYVNGVFKKLNQLGLSCTNQAGKFNVVDFIGQIKEADLVITNDSSPLHLANYFNVPCIAIWGPTSSNLVGYSNSKYMLNISSKQKCSPCFEHPKSEVAKACNHQITCFKELAPNCIATDVIQFVNQLKNE
jgi:hypothetical protein